MHKGFGSDNHATVHPKMMEALVQVNRGHAHSYGFDETTMHVSQLFKDHFGSYAEVFLVFNGTAANVISLSFLVQRFQSVFCSQTSHINNDECGAPEFFAGKLIPIPDVNGIINFEELKNSYIRRGDQHYSQAKAISITQPTELGTCYSLQEIKKICDWAHSNRMYVHMDGARITNALVELNCTYKELTTDLGVDVVSFGGTKNGFMMGEAIIVLNKELLQTKGEEFKYIRKQAGQLPSKTRYLSAQFEAYFKDELYLKLARHSVSMAQLLFEKLSQISEVKINRPRQSNVVFACLPKAWVKTLREKFFFYVWDEKTFECRLMCSWDTEPQEIENFVEEIKRLKSQVSPAPSALE